MKKSLAHLFIFFLSYSVFSQVRTGYIEEELGLDTTKIENFRSLISEDLKKGIFDINFVGDANIQNSINAGSPFTANTGVGVILNRFWIGETNKLRQFHLSLSINVASTADVIESEINSSTNTITNQRDFGTFLLLPDNSKQSASLYSILYFNSYSPDKKTFANYISGCNIQVLGSRVCLKNAF